MSVILTKGYIQQGQVVVPKPIDLPDGTEVVVSNPTTTEDDSEDGWDNSPEGIAEWLKWYDSLEPLVFTDEERAAWNAARQSQKDWEMDQFDQHAEKLRSMWE
jgi:hypothetical protein